MRQVLTNTRKSFQSMQVRTAVSGAFQQRIAAVPESVVTTLPNGLRVATERTDQPGLASIGVHVGVGSRYENEQNNGVAHFLEHMIFKGTSTGRTREQFEQQIEQMGASFNAYTTRELTYFNAVSFKEDIGNMMEIMADCILNPAVTDHHVESERGTILREMQEVESQTEEVVYDYLHGTAFQGSPLSYTILGSENNIKTISREDILSFVDTHYTAPNVVLTVTGDFDDHTSIVKMAENLFGNLPNQPRNGIPPEKRSAVFIGSDVRARFDSYPLAHVAYSFPTAGWNDPDNIPLLVLSGLIGSITSPHTSNKHSPAPIVASLAAGDACVHMHPFHTQYSDVGLFGVYLQGTPTQLNDMMFYVAKGMTGFCYNVDPVLLESTKLHLRTRQAAATVGEGSHEVVGEALGRELLQYGRRMSPAEFDARVAAVTAEDVMAVANKYLYDRDHALAAVGPIYDLPDYNALREKSTFYRY